LEEALAVEDPTARITVLQKFLKANNVPEQAQTAREALVASWAQLADNNIGENNLDRAMENFRRAIGGLPEQITDRFFEETVIRIPYALSIRGYRNEAVELARQLEKRLAQESLRLAALGEFYMTVEAAPDAIHALETATKLAGETPRLHRLLGAAYRMGLRLDEAIAEYQLATDYDPNDKRAYYELANLYRAHGAYADAIKLYRKQLEIDPKHSSSHKGMALAYLAQGDEEQMAAALNQARDLRGSAEEITGDIYLQTQLAFHYLAQNKLKQAQQAAEAALVVEPRYSWARIAAAEIDLAQGKYFEAERNLLAARSYANFPTLYFTFGKLYLAVEDFDGAIEQFSKAFTYSPQKLFTTKLGGFFDVQAESVKDLLAREHQAAIFLAEPATTDETFKLADALVRFNIYLNRVKTPVTPGASHSASKGAPSNAEAQRKQIEEMDRAAMDFIEVENSRRSYRMLYIAGQLAQSGVATGLTIELADQALGLAEVATEPDGSLRDYPNYDRNGRLAIFRGRALSAKGWSQFKANKGQDAIATLTESVKAYGTLAEGKRAKWRLATVKESEGELKEALDLYVAGYEPPTAGSEIDLNRAVIESVYRKIYRSLEGLNKLLGVSEASSSLSSSGSSNNPFGASTIPQANPTSQKADTPSKSNAKNMSAKSASKAGASLAEKGSKKIDLTTQPPHPSDVPAPEAAKEQPAADQPTVPPAPPAPKPIELPAINGLDAALPLASIVDLSAFVSYFDNINAQSASAEEPPAPPSAKTHTRKRRVTAPDNQ
jgi:tetratricopeptide (TPR) repeat protein